MELFLLPQSPNQMMGTADSNAAAMLATEGVAESSVMHRLLRAHGLLAEHARTVHRYIIKLLSQQRAAPQVALAMLLNMRQIFVCGLAAKHDCELNVCPAW